MAAALQPIHNDLGNPSGPNSLYPSGIMSDYTFGDNRYPAIRPQSRATQQSNSRPGTSDRSWQPAPTSSEAQSLYKSGSSPSWQSNGVYQGQTEAQYIQYQSSRQSDQQRSPASDNYPTPQQDQDSHKTSLSYALPPPSSRRVVERYSLEDNGQVLPLNEPRPPPFALENQSVQETVTARSRPTTPQGPRVASPQGRLSPNATMSKRSAHQNGSLGQASLQTSSAQFPPIIPLAASPAYAPPIASTNRAYAQQPTYVTQPNPNKPIQPVYTPIVPQQEEVCVECAMRDQDMADVDVSSPGVWERASDVVFEDLKRRELEEEAAGVLSNDPSRPRIRGGRLTEQNLKIWLSINPREPASKQQTLNNYIKSQRALLEAEAHAHARAMQEAKQLDNRMRDAYSQLRRSAYDTGSTSSAIDDLGGVRIKPPVAAPMNHSRARSHSREVTLLENGMIVEHVDVRKEEREAREQRKREDRRARKSSRSSVMDVGSIVSAQSSGQIAENYYNPYARQSQVSSPRPASAFGLGVERPDLPRAYSQASFSDVHSLTSGSPRRTRFFGMKNLSAGWRSQDSLAPSGMSGSMSNMHLAAYRDSHGPNGLTAPPIDLNTPRRSQIWPPIDLEDPNATQVQPDDKSKKKKGGLAKIWRIVTGKNDDQTKNVSVYQGQMDNDDTELAPPPPLSYLVDRKPHNDLSSNGGTRQTSTPSLSSPKFPTKQPSPGMSPPTAPSSILPSPASLRQSGDIEIAGMNEGLAYNDETIRQDEGSVKIQNNWKSVQSLTSETDSRQQNSPGSPVPAAIDNSTLAPPPTLTREKSLPPLPVGEAPAQVLPTDRPRTYYGMDTRAVAQSPDAFAPPQAPFRGGDMRRQSFGGMSSRPNLNVQTLPVTQPVDFDARRTFNPRYDEFGASRRSLGRLDQFHENSRTMSPLPTATKRKSKFGLSSLLGKKQDKREQQQPDLIYNHDLGPQFISTPYDPQDDLTTAGYATSTSRHSALSSGNNPTSNGRMSVAPRRPLEELVQQDSEFLAYRYPSNDQPLDLLR